MNISSIVVQVRNEFVDSVVEVIKNCDFCDYHFHDVSIGKIIVTVEGESIGQEMEKVKKIEELKHVITAEMMMSYSEDELDREREALGKSDAVPDILKNDAIRAEDITYNGDLKKKF
ncbi:MAG: chaperone NapD [Sulfurospirillum sp.]|nr:chaperone NapD [Sulfurospirillum sp.]